MQVVRARLTRVKTDFNTITVPDGTVTFFFREFHAPDLWFVAFEAKVQVPVVEQCSDLRVGRDSGTV